MTAPTNTLTTSINVGAKEDFENMIYKVGVAEIPLSSSIGKVTAKNTYHSWQTAAYAAPTLNNIVSEGSDATNDAPNITSRIGTYLQITRKTAAVSDTAEAVDYAGRSSEMAEEMLMKGVELLKDNELTFCSTQVSTASDPRQTGGVQSWIATNVSHGAGGTAGGYNSGTGLTVAPTAGTGRAFTEALLKAQIQNAFNNGSRPNVLLMGMNLKQEAGAFTGIAVNRHEVGDKSGQKKIIGATDIYVGDTGEIQFVPHAYAFTNAALLYTPAMLSIATLRGVKRTPLAKTGSSERVMIEAEQGLVCKNEKSHALILDLQ